MRQTTPQWGRSAPPPTQTDLTESKQSTFSTTRTQKQGKFPKLRTAAEFFPNRFAEQIFAGSKFGRSTIRRVDWSLSFCLPGTRPSRPLDTRHENNQPNRRASGPFSSCSRGDLTTLTPTPCATSPTPPRPVPPRFAGYGGTVPAAKTSEKNGQQECFFQLIPPIRPSPSPHVRTPHRCPAETTLQAAPPRRHAEPPTPSAHAAPPHQGGRRKGAAGCNENTTRVQQTTTTTTARYPNYNLRVQQSASAKATGTPTTAARRSNGQRQRRSNTQQQAHARERSEAGHQPTRSSSRPGHCRRHAGNGNVHYNSWPHLHNKTRRQRATGTSRQPTAAATHADAWRNRQPLSTRRQQASITATASESSRQQQPRRHATTATRGHHERQRPQRQTTPQQSHAEAASNDSAAATNSSRRTHSRAAKPMMSRHSRQRQQQLRAGIGNDNHKDG